MNYAARGGVFVTAQAGEFLLPAGQTATLSDTVLSACNALTYGYQPSGGSFSAVGGIAAGCSTTSEADATIGPFPTAVIFDLVLVDETCGQTFESTGGHAAVSGTNPYDVDITDAGASGEAPEGTTRPPSLFGRNLSTTVTIG